MVRKSGLQNLWIIAGRRLREVRVSEASLLLKGYAIMPYLSVYFIAVLKGPLETVVGVLG